MDVELNKGYPGEGFGEGNVRGLAGWGGGRIYIFIIFGNFFRLILQVVFRRSFFRILNDLCVCPWAPTLVFFVLF